ncbi:hypothetical protein [Kitasatospora indigofera]|uniref:hypothetical protein n=1 Tax=Kitasatospora indigofera TaxID=67307 RepID=UPI0033A9FE3E
MDLYRDTARLALLPLSAVHEAILSDLDPQAGGVSWWAGHLDTPRRILIGDYLLSLTRSTEDNLVEAAMHVHRFSEAQEAETQWFKRRALTRSLRGERWLDPDRETANRRVEAEAHLGGFFRAVGSVMDNLAGLVIGVAGLSTKIVRADISHLSLDKPSPKGALPDGLPGRAVQLELIGELKAAINDGPEDWLPWLDHMRNTLVHRARRLTFSLQDPRQPSGFLHPLCQAPDWTDAEAIARSGGRPLADCLTEDATVTMQGALLTAVNVTRLCASAAARTWAERRTKPDLIMQPQQQWPQLANGRQTNFQGWDPGRLPKLVPNSSLLIHPSRARRIQAGLFSNESRPQWSAWLRES